MCVNRRSSSQWAALLAVTLLSSGCATLPGSDETSRAPASEPTSAPSGSGEQQRSLPLPKKLKKKRALIVRDPRIRDEIREEASALKSGKKPASTHIALVSKAKATTPLSGGEAKSQFKGQRPVPVSDTAHSQPVYELTTLDDISSAGSVDGTNGTIEAAAITDLSIAEPGTQLREPPTLDGLKQLRQLEDSNIQLSNSSETPLIFDIPVTYNERVKTWIRFFQNEGRVTFKNWLERSSRYLPLISYELTRAGLPQDLVYVAMIESGFVPYAVSHANAMGMWQFIVPTGKRFGLKIDWWIDERRDFHKSTRSAISYMNTLYKQFNSWYLVAASYNMGENGVRRLIKKHGTNNFWDLADRNALPKETRDYVPKIIAAMLISKAPALYGFRDLEYQMPLSFENVTVPGGTDIPNLASYLGVSEKYLKDLNPELTKGFIPRYVRSHSIRVPKGSTMMVGQYVRLNHDGHYKGSADLKAVNGNDPDDYEEVSF